MYSKFEYIRECTQNLSTFEHIHGGMSKLLGCKLHPRQFSPNPGGYTWVYVLEGDGPSKVPGKLG